MPTIPYNGRDPEPEARLTWSAINETDRRIDEVLAMVRRGDINEVQAFWLVVQWREERR